MATVHTPAEGYTGVVVGVQFKDGTGETDDLAALAYFNRKGYRVEGASKDESDEEPEDDGKVYPVPAKSASKAEWVDYALTHGHAEDDLDGLTKDEIIDLF